MAIDSGTPASLTQLPGEVTPYFLPAGGGRSFLLLGQVQRILTGEEETDGVMSVASLCGPSGRPIPLHFHEAEDEYFFCVRGRVQVWANDESRVLTPGGLAAVPAGTVHAFRMLDHNSMFMGPIIPGGWDRFFDFCGTPYSSPLYPQVDDSPPPFDKFAAAQAKFNMTYIDDGTYADPTYDAPDDALPGQSQPYFLRAGEGPRHVLFGQVCFQLVSGAESKGTVGMTVTEGPRGAGTPPHRHATTYEGIYCLDGRIRVRLGDGERELIGRDYVSIPPGTVHGHEVVSDFARFITLHGPAGPERLHELAGEASEHRIFPAQAPPLDQGRLQKACAQIDVEFVD